MLVSYKWLKELVDVDVTTAELAEKIGVDASTVCLWEQGKRIPKYASIKRVAKLFGCSLGDVIDVD